MSKNWAKDNLFNIITLLVVAAGSIYNYGAMNAKIEEQQKQITRLREIVEIDHDSITKLVASQKSENLWRN